MAKITLPNLKNKQETYPEVFIIESLTTADEHAKRFEGLQLCEILRMAGQNPKYIYFQEESELQHIIPLFYQSQYRFLHFSCHGNDTEFLLCGGKLSYDSFADHFENALFFRRLFISACSTGNKSLLEKVLAKNHDLHSLVAPSIDLQCNHALIMWSALYTSLIEKNVKGINSRDLYDTLQKLVNLFPLSLNPTTRRKEKTEFLFGYYNSVKQSWNNKTVSEKVKKARCRPDRVAGAIR
jgi:hypothetical protein